MENLQSNRHLLETRRQIQISFDIFPKQHNEPALFIEIFDLLISNEFKYTRSRKGYQCQSIFESFKKKKQSLGD